MTLARRQPSRRTGTAQSAAPVPRYRRLVLPLAAAALLSAACSPGTKAPAALESSAAASSSAATPAASETETALAGSLSPTGTPPSATPVTSKPTGAAPASTAPARPSGADGCPTSALAVAALRGSGAAGHQYAFLQFTNKSAKACTLTGFPGVQLLRAGAPLGKPAVRSSKPATRVQLMPGRSAQARLVVDSTCNAEKSDSVQIYPPNRTEKVTVPLSIRGCALTIDPVVAG